MLARTGHRIKHKDEWREADLSLLRPAIYFPEKKKTGFKGISLHSMVYCRGVFGVHA